MPGTTYRFYVEANDPSDKFSAVFGNDQYPLVIDAPDGIYNETVLGTELPGNPALFAVFPQLEFDSWLTIGLDVPTNAAAEALPSLVQDSSLDPTISGFFTTDGATSLNVNTLTGGSWYVLNTAANALPTDGRWLIAQITTAGDLSGTLNGQIFPLGVGCGSNSTGHMAL